MQESQHGHQCKPIEFLASRAKTSEMLCMRPNRYTVPKATALSSYIARCMQTLSANAELLQGGSPNVYAQLQVQAVPDIIADSIVAIRPAVSGANSTDDCSSTQVLQPVQAGQSRAEHHKMLVANVLSSRTSQLDSSGTCADPWLGKISVSTREIPVTYLTLLWHSDATSSTINSDHKDVKNPDEEHAKASIGTAQHRPRPVETLTHLAGQNVFNMSSFPEGKSRTSTSSMADTLQHMLLHTIKLQLEAQSVLGC